ncbi:hypothetical protein [Pseudomonas sp. TMW 2.1634]|uniref:hypothetical protein n=1 Tax=Pseudomonas sp. TMW 2.1634 TaxID=1886807 RepID=UPI000E760E47|nr:hypothetical protein [Pseudomonas sp. TMW 2.1634]AOA06170.1 hypothetical protein BFC21_10375 [Pseudomonas sp. TMW 2.1634]
MSWITQADFVGLYPGDGFSDVKRLCGAQLLAVICQTLEPHGTQRTLTVKSRRFSGEDGPGIREKIRTGQVQQIDQDVGNQSQRSLWG